MEDCVLSNEEIKRLIILYRATFDYPNHSVQGTVKFLLPRIPDDWTPSPNELQFATHWWKYHTTEEERQKLLIQYKFGAKKK